VIGIIARHAPLVEWRRLWFLPSQLATIVHEGSHANVDLAYGSLATYVTEHALGIDGPLREYYLVGPQDTYDANAWRTEIGWPIFQTGLGRSN
jgi:effector-binding domain-containing protein